MHESNQISEHKKGYIMNKKKISVFKRICMLSTVILMMLTATLSLTACGKSNIPENTVFSVDDLAGKSDWRTVRNHR